MKSRWIMTLALAALGAAIMPGLAQAANEPVIGVVDHNKVLAEYEAYRKADEQYNQFMMERQQEWDEAAATRLLSDEEKQELTNLKAVAAPTRSQKGRLEDLLDLTAQRLAELRELSVLPKRDEKQEARMKELSELLATRDKQTRDLKERLDKEVEDKADELMKPINDKVEAALETVAKQMGLLAVLSKESVLYGGEDVTAKVLAELNKEA